MILVWKCVDVLGEQMEVGLSKAFSKPIEWIGKQGASYFVGKKYRFPGSMVGAGPWGVVKNYVPKPTITWLGYQLVEIPEPGSFCRTYLIVDPYGRILCKSDPISLFSYRTTKLAQFVKDNSDKVLPEVFSGHVLAILAKPQYLIPHAHPMGGVFMCERGLPVAAYKVTRISDDEIEPELVEGEDIARELGVF